MVLFSNLLLILSQPAEDETFRSLISLNIPSGEISIPGIVTAAGSGNVTASVVWEDENTEEKWSFKAEAHWAATIGSPSAFVRSIRLDCDLGERMRQNLLGFD